MKKKTVILFLVFAMLVVAVFAGCAKTEEPTAEETQVKETAKTNEEKEPSSEEPETVKLDISRPSFGVDPAGTMVEEAWLEKMNEYLNVDLQINFSSIPWADYREKEAIVLASGDYPDIFTNSYEDTVKEYGGQGMLLELSPYRDLMVNYQKFVDGTPDGEDQAWANGVAYGFQDGMDNSINIEGSQAFTSFAYRFDILEKHEIEIPSTLDEFYEVAKKLKELYPDVYPIGSSAKAYTIQRGLNGIFHTFDTYFYDGEKWQYGPSQDNYRDMMRFLHKLYAEGLIDPGYFSDDDDTITQKVLTDKTFICTTLWAGMPNRWINDDNPDMVWGMAYLPENPEYGTPWKWGSQKKGFSLQTRFQTVISADTQYPELCVKMIDYQYSDEMNLLMNWGFEGVTYVYDENGNKTYTEEIMNSENIFQGLADYGILASTTCRPGIVWSPQNFEAGIVLNPKTKWYNDGEYYDMSFWTASNEFGGPDSISPTDRAPAVLLTTDEAELRSNIITACNTYANESAVAFITGTMDLEADWDEYLDTLKAMGDYQQVLDLMDSKS